MENVVQRLLSSTTDCNITAWVRPFESYLRFFSMICYFVLKREFTLLLIPLLTRKLKRIIPSLLMRPSLLAHTIYQALAFDAALGEAGFGLSGTSAGHTVNPQEVEDKWNGVSEVILGNKQWFDSWMEGERKCMCIVISMCHQKADLPCIVAEDQYNEIISAIDAWVIADDDQDEDGVQRELRSTNSARRIKALVEQVTGEKIIFWSV